MLRLTQSAVAQSKEASEPDSQSMAGTHSERERETEREGEGGKVEEARWTRGWIVAK